MLKKTNNKIINSSSVVKSKFDFNPPAVLPGCPYKTENQHRPNPTVFINIKIVSTNKVKSKSLLANIITNWISA